MRFVLQRSTNSGASWVNVSTSIPSTTRSFGVSVANGYRHSFRIAAVNSAGQGAWSTVVSATPHPPCHPSYPTVCIRILSGDALNCGDITYRRFAVVTPPAPYTRDPYGFDGNNDGVGCES